MQLVLWLVTHPEAPFPSQHAEEQLQLLHRDAVTGQDPQHVHQQVCEKTSNTQAVHKKRGEIIDSKCITVGTNNQDRCAKDSQIVWRQ